jgi:uncharacterized protein YndB with AHSA1/START domain
LSVDVQTEVEIARPRVAVGTYAADPDNAPDWYENIERVDWKTKKKRFGVGSQFEFVGGLFGRKLAYTYTVTEYVPLERLVMHSAEGPFALETTYTWQDAGDGGTRMTLRNQGEPTGLSSRIASPLMASAMRRANRNDLIRLKELLEGS